MKLKTFLVVCLWGCFAYPADSRAQDVAIKKIEDSLVLNADSMYNAYLPELRVIYCEKFIRQLVRALKHENSYAYPFTALGKVINILQPEDMSFRIFNWVVPVTNVNVRYYGAIQMQGANLKLYPLNDYASELQQGLEDSILTHEKWFGAIYYDILKKEVDGKAIYTLLGKNESSLVSSRKVMEPLYFTDKEAVFGVPVFRTSKKKINRFVLEYRKDVSVSLKWDKEYNAVTFDHLVSQVNDPNRKYTFVPTGQYDGFSWENGAWTLMEDVIPVQVFKDGEAPAPSPRTPKE